MFAISVIGTMTLFVCALRPDFEVVLGLVSLHHSHTDHG